MARTNRGGGDPAVGAVLAALGKVQDCLDRLTSRVASLEARVTAIESGSGGRNLRNDGVGSPPRRISPKGSFLSMRMRSMSDLPSAPLARPAGSRDPTPPSRAVAKQAKAVKRTLEEARDILNVKVEPVLSASVPVSETLLEKMARSKYARVQRLLPGRPRAVDLAEACGRSDVDDVHILVGIRALDVTSTQARTSQCQPSAMVAYQARNGKESSRWALRGRSKSVADPSDHWVGALKGFPIVIPIRASDIDGSSCVATAAIPPTASASGVVDMEVIIYAEWLSISPSDHDASPLAYLVQRFDMSSDEAEQPRKVVLHFERDSANIVFALLPAKVGALQAKCAVLASPGLGYTSYLPSFSFGVGWNARRNRLRKTSVDLDLVAVLLDEKNAVVETVNHFFSGTLETSGFDHSGDNNTGREDGTNEAIAFDLNRLPPHVSRVVLAVNGASGEAFRNVALLEVLVEADVGIDTVDLCSWEIPDLDAHVVATGESNAVILAMVQVLPSGTSGGGAVPTTFAPIWSLVRWEPGSSLDAEFGPMVCEAVSAI